MKKILLMGNPNVGKSVFFNRLTGANVIESNYPGTTVDYAKGYMKVSSEWHSETCSKCAIKRVEREEGTEDFEIIDVPGTFSLEPKDKAEEVAVKMLEEEKGALVICVVDASKIERGLYLCLEIIERGYPVVLALNMWDVAEDKNVQIDIEKLKSILNIPVVPTIAISGKGFKEVVLSIKKAALVRVNEIMEKVGEIK
ncbi:50S ribosome-binding GTPase [bacterium]|nr:50S ribosome-binding GTPase [bacterium]MBU4509666.1 50S ribosome-binding GTPase [bacterium]